MAGTGRDHFIAVRTFQKVGLAISAKRGFIGSRQKKGVDQCKRWKHCAVDPPTQKRSPLTLCDDGGQKTDQDWKKDGPHIPEFIIMESRSDYSSTSVFDLISKPIDKAQGFYVITLRFVLSII